MKTKLLIILLGIVSLSTYAQSKYYTMAQCGNDKLKYIEKNYEQNKAKYIGKTIGFWADETELKLGTIIPTPFGIWWDDKTLVDKIRCIMFVIPHWENSDYFEYDITIDIDGPYVKTWRQALDLGGNKTGRWGPKFYDFYKDLKIKDMYVFKMKNDKHLRNYTRP